MDGKIGLEEHFAIADTVRDSADFLPPEDWEELSGRPIDPEDRRLREMDANGMETTILPLNAPVVQAIPDVAQAAGAARRANDGQPWLMGPGWAFGQETAVHARRLFDPGG